jgi:di/tricarboxylate transporter
LGWQGYATLGITGLVLAALVRDVAPDAVFLGALVLLALLGVITPGEAFAGFSNEGVLTVAALFVVAAGLNETGVMGYIAERVLGRAKQEKQALARLSLLLIPASAFLNNTPIVAMLVPPVIEWCRRRSISPSRLLIPVSYLTILGGTCSLIGTSTNLVVQGLMQEAGLRPMHLLEIGYVGLPGAILGTAYLMTIGRRLLPDRKELIEQLGEARREYLAEMTVMAGSRLVGRSVEDAGLRQLPGLFLIEIDRDGHVMAPVGPDEVLQADDRLVFTGVVSTLVDLERFPGLVPAADMQYQVSPALRRGRRLCEAVISRSSPLVGQTVRTADFRTLYDAAVVAVHRNGHRVTNKVGDIELEAGDTLLLQVGPRFARVHRNNPDFYLVSDVENSGPLRSERAWASVAILAGLIAVMSSGFLDITIATFLAAGLMVASRCISAADARRAVDWPMLVAIAAAFGLGTALERSGAAGLIASELVGATRPLGPAATLAAIYLATMILTEIISNNAAAVLAFPFGLSAAAILDVDPKPFVVAVALAASNAYASPIGYQTHMMVYGPGGYRFGDFVRVGLPLKLILWAIAVVLIPRIWRF